MTAFTIARYILLTVNTLGDFLVLGIVALWLYGRIKNPANVPGFSSTRPMGRPPKPVIAPVALLAQPPKSDPWEDHYEKYERTMELTLEDRHATCVVVKSAQARCTCGWTSETWSGGESSGMAQLDWVQHKALFCPPPAPD
jgi:hypothetical protein